MNYLGLRKKANECLFEWNHVPFGTAIKQSATHTKHSCCGLTTDISQVIQSIVIEGNDERLFGLQLKSARALRILWASVFVSIACVYFSSSLAEWSWPHFKDTLKATRIQHPSSSSPHSTHTHTHTNNSLYCTHTSMWLHHSVIYSGFMFLVSCVGFFKNSTSQINFLSSSLQTDCKSKYCLSMLLKNMLVCFDNHIKPLVM